MAYLYNHFFDTEDLTITKISLDDAVRFHEICNQSFVLKWMPDWQSSFEEAENLIKFFLQGYVSMNPELHPLLLAIRLKRDNILVGVCGYGEKKEIGNEIEICYFIDENHSGQGYMGQVITKAIDFYFDLTKKSYLCAMVDKNNIASYSLLVKNGFKGFNYNTEANRIQSHYRVYR